MKKTFFLVALTTLLSCTEKKVDLKELKNEVFDTHDEVMPKMGDLRRARKSLMLWADSIQTTDSLKAQELTIVSNRLAEANEGMMAWMRNFKPDSSGTYEQELSYLSAQKEEIVAVKDEMMEALAAGKQLLGDHFPPSQAPTH